MKNSMNLRLIASLATVVAITAVASRANAGTATFYNNSTAFTNAIASSTLLTFEGIVADNQYQDHFGSVSFGAVSFSGLTTPGSVGQVVYDVVGKNAPYGVSSFRSAILAEGNRNSLRVTLPNGTVAVGTEFGAIDYTGQASNRIRLTLRDSNAVVLDTRIVDLASMYVSADVGYLAYTVTDGTAKTLDIENVDPNGFDQAFSLGVDNFQYSSQLAPTSGAAPEPAAIALLLPAFPVLGAVLRRRRKAI